MPRWRSESELVPRLSRRPWSTVPRLARGATTLITPMIARLTATMDRPGLRAACLSAPGPGTTGVGAIRMDGDITDTDTAITAAWRTAAAMDTVADTAEPGQPMAADMADIGAAALAHSAQEPADTQAGLAEASTAAVAADFMVAAATGKVLRFS